MEVSGEGLCPEVNVVEVMIALKISNSNNVFYVNRMALHCIEQRFVMKKNEVW